MARLFPLLAGLLFGAGLGVSRGADPEVVLGFLDFFGDWDPRLLAMFGGSLVVYAPMYRLVARARRRPLFAPEFDAPVKAPVDWRLVAGAAIFGVGWGLAGFCPGPGFVTLGVGRIEPVVFMASMLTAMLVFERAPRRT